MSEETIPSSLDELWEITREHLQRDDAAGLDERLSRIGDAVVNSREEPQAPHEQLVYRTWRTATPEIRNQLAELWIKAVGHAEFPQE